MRTTILPYDSLPDPGEKFTLSDEIRTGVWAKVIKATDNDTGKTVAIKIQSYDADNKNFVDEEYRILRDFSEHPNLLNFYGAYRQREFNEVWFILEYCEGHTAIDFINKLQAINRRPSEEHIAFILRETVSALIHLHKNHFVHRDVQGSNILLTAEGEIKLCDFGLTAPTGSTLGKRSTCIGTPNYMAPEMFGLSSSKRNDETYGNRADVWSIGITAIELGDGSAPFTDMHPTRAMFQIVRNPPPTLYRPANWTQNYNDFISECLEKNPDNRPFMIELMEHPFFTQLIGPNGSDHHLSCELKHLINQVSSMSQIPRESIALVKNCLKKYANEPEKMFVEDLSAMDKLTDDRIIDEIKQRLMKGESYSFIGDVLVSVNSNELPNQYPRSFHNKYICKSRSENAPHIFSVADSAYQDMLHHEEPQHIIFAGESFSGKTTNMKLAIKHLTVLGEGNPNCCERVIQSIDFIHALINAGTPLNPNSTRCALQTQLTYNQTGKLSGAIYSVYLLDKLRVSSTNMDQSNFHIFYYFYDAMKQEKLLSEYELNGDRKYRYLRIPDEPIDTKLPYVRDDPEGNADKYREFEANLKSMDIDDEHITSMRKILAAILVLGNVRFKDDAKFATIETVDEVHKIAKLLNLDGKKFEWAMVNYCYVQSGVAERRKHTSNDARDARDILASAIYCRLVDWIVNIVNQKFSLGRAVFGDIHVISLTDMFGFECFNRNDVDQLMINSLNEQLQYHYNQRMFAWEMLEREEEQLPGAAYRYTDNRTAVDHLMSKPYGLFHIIDDATKGRMNHEYITDTIIGRKSSYVQRVSKHEFSVAHYTGKVTYHARNMVDKNRDFVPPEMLETLRSSNNTVVKLFFTNQLTKTGNLTVAFEQKLTSKTRAKWGQALVAEKQKAKKINTLSHGQYSQIHMMRTLSGVFRATSLEILKGLSIGGSSGNTHFVRCIRSSLEYKPKAFQVDMVHQQVRALAVLDTAVARQKGYPMRLSFQEFLRRYKFLAFDFDENVDLTKDNCRLLLIRLKMEGWAIGASKVFLKYYNVEYLSRLYETQVKKIVKVQAMMRAFLAKRNVTSKLMKIKEGSAKKQLKRLPSTDEAAITIQKAYRGFKVRQKYGPLLNAKTGEIDIETSKFIKSFAKRWREKTIFQVLLHYRAARYQDLVSLTQQIHIYNQAVVAALKINNECILLEKIDPKETNPALLGPKRPTVNKLPFRLNDIPFFDTSYLCDPLSGATINVLDEDSDNEEWDAPLKRTINVSSQILQSAKSYESINLNNPNSRFGLRPTGSTYLGNAPLKERFESKQNLSNKVPVYKKPSAPIHHETDNTVRATTTDVPAVNADLSSALKKLNPVKEMQMRGRNNNEEDDDQPPFNFQGLLRKTQHQRASMKRSKDDEQNANDTENIIYSSNGNLNNNNSNETTSVTPSDFDFDENDNAPVALPRKALAPSPKERKLSFGEDTVLGANVALENIGTYIQEEIQPGIVLEGYAVEI